MKKSKKEPQTEEQLQEPYRRAMGMFCEAFQSKGFTLDPAGETFCRILYYLGYEAALTAVGEIRFLDPSLQEAQWKRIVGVAEKGVKP